jgi:hypothetical protein
MRSETVNQQRQSAVPLLVLDRQGAATALCISVRKLDYLIQRGEVAATRVDGRVLVAWAELLRFVECKSTRKAMAPTA